MLTESITISPFFDVQGSKNRENRIEDKATVMVMGLVQDEDMEWVVANNVGFLFF
jgi:alanine racemase